MKRIAQILVAAVVFLSHGIVSAANWEWITSDDRVGYFFDADTIHYELEYNTYQNKYTPNSTKITYWIKTIFTQKGANEEAKRTNDDKMHSLYFTISLETISLSESTYTLHRILYYNHTGHVIDSMNIDPIANLIPSYLQTEKFIPGTQSEVIFNAVRDYARSHHDDLVRNAYRN